MRKGTLMTLDLLLRDVQVPSGPAHEAVGVPDVVGATTPLGVAGKGTLAGVARETLQLSRFRWIRHLAPFMV